jgi:hypothetical protein
VSHIVVALGVTFHTRCHADLSLRRPCRASASRASRRSEGGGNLDGLWGTSGRDVFAVANSDGTILHYDGTRWAPMESGTTLPLAGIWRGRASDRNSRLRASDVAEACGLIEESVARRCWSRRVGGEGLGDPLQGVHELAAGHRLWQGLPFALVQQE